MKIISFTATLFVALAGGLAMAQENPGTPWPATDVLGRVLPLEAEVGPPKVGKLVGIFYFINHAGDVPRSELLAGRTMSTRFWRAIRRR